MAPRMAEIPENPPERMLSSMRVMVWLTVLPAPMLVCPTSEFPINPTGSPTSSPDAERRACGHSSIHLRKLCAGALVTALCGPASA